jgi:very-short-patch-repair endonuclease
MRHPTTQEQHAYMKMRQTQNLTSSQRSDAENWFLNILERDTDLTWTRQAQWGYRLFDFWSAQLGVAIEVDGREHNAQYDTIRDEHNYKRSGIIVFRVSNFDEDRASEVIEALNTITETWIERRARLGILSKAQKKSLNLN